MITIPSNLPYGTVPNNSSQYLTVHRTFKKQKILKKEKKEEKQKVLTGVAREGFVEEVTCVIIMNISIANICWVIPCTRFYSRHFTLSSQFMTTVLT